MLIRKVSESISQIRKFTDKEVEIGLILGSGLAPIADRLENKVVIPYSEIPHFKSRRHRPRGPFHFGDLGGVPILCMQGRLHYYEGYSMQELTYPIRVMAKLGIKNLIITNACGGLDPNGKPGDLMLITDHINYMGDNPLIGANEDDFGPRFPDMTKAYDPDLRSLALKVAADLDISWPNNVYLSYQQALWDTGRIRWIRIEIYRRVSTIPGHRGGHTPDSRVGIAITNLPMAASRRAYRSEVIGRK